MTMAYKYILLILLLNISIEGLSAREIPPVREKKIGAIKKKLQRIKSSIIKQATKTLTLVRTPLKKEILSEKEIISIERIVANRIIEWRRDYSQSIPRKSKLKG